MSKNYTNYQNISKKTDASAETVTPTEDTISVKEVIDAATKVEEVENVEETVVAGDTFGIVTDCKKLNIRTKPDKVATVACVADEGTTLQIDIDKSTLEWYSVRTASGVEGFCMKKFVAVR